MSQNTDIATRWENYRKANSDKPSARENELSEIFSLVNPQLGERILEVGTGNGYLTFPLAQAVGSTGEVVTTDVNEGNVKDATEKNRNKNYNVTALLLPVGEGMLKEERYNDYFDAVTSIATLHHFDNRLDNTGDSGRKEALAQFHKNLKPGGRLVIADVLHGTISQKYFDAIDNPEHCHPLGHPHDFFTKEALREAVENVGFKKVNINVKFVPWQFTSKEETMNFIHTIHNAKCSAEDSLNVAEKHLGLNKAEEGYELGWELFFLTAEK